MRWVAGIICLVAALLFRTPSLQAATAFYYSNNSLTVTSSTCSGMACSYANAPFGSLSFEVHFFSDTAGLSGNAVGGSNFSNFDYAAGSFGGINGFSELGLQGPNIGSLFVSVLQLSNGWLTGWSVSGQFSKFGGFCGFCDSFVSSPSSDQVTFTDTFFTDGSSYTLIFNGPPGVWSTDIPLPTPIPAALPLFATGLGALGLLARRRKQKLGLLGTSRIAIRR